MHICILSVLASAIERKVKLSKNFLQLRTSTFYKILDPASSVLWCWIHGGNFWHNFTLCAFPLPSPKWLHNAQLCILITHLVLHENYVFQKWKCYVMRGNNIHAKSCIKRFFPASDDINFNNFKSSLITYCWMLVLGVEWNESLTSKDLWKSIQVPWISVYRKINLKLSSTMPLLELFVNSDSEYLKLSFFSRQSSLG